MNYENTNKKALKVMKEVLETKLKDINEAIKSKQTQGEKDLQEAFKFAEKELSGCIFMVLTLQIENNNLLIELPEANNEWTFAVWDICKKIVEKFPKSYISFDEKHRHRFQYISFDYE